MKPGARPPDMAGGECQSDEAARIVGAMNMLADPHSPENDCALGAGIEPGGTAYFFRLYAASLAHRLGRKVAHLLRQISEALGVGLDVLPVGEPLFHDDMEHRVEKSDIAPRLEAQIHRRPP